MKSKFYLLILVAIIIPQITFAAWWNPFSWKIFNRTNPQVEKQERKLDPSEPNSVVTRFYIKNDNSRIRSCPSTDCEVIGYYKKDSEITMQGERVYQLSDLPEWLEHTTFEGLRGYINKSILSEGSINRPPLNEFLTESIENIQDKSTKNYNDILIDLINLQITKIDEGIGYAKLLSTQIKDEIKYVEGRRQLMVDAKAGVRAGDKWSNTAFGIFVEFEDEILTKYRNTLNSLNQVITSLETNKSIAQQNISIFRSNFYTSERETTADVQTILKNMEEDVQLFNLVHQINDGFIKEFAEDEAEYRKGLEAWRASFEDRYRTQTGSLNYQQSNRTFQPIVIPQIQMPKTTYCTMSNTYGANYSIICN